MNTKNHRINRAERLIEFHEMTNPLVKLFLVATILSVVAFYVTSLGHASDDVCQVAFSACLASVGGLAFFGLPWIAGRGYKIMEAEQNAIQRQQALRLRATRLHASR